MVDIEVSPCNLLVNTELENVSVSVLFGVMYLTLTLTLALSAMLPFVRISENVTTIPASSSSRCMHMWSMSSHRYTL